MPVLPEDGGLLARMAVPFSLTAQPPQGNPLSGGPAEALWKMLILSTDSAKTSKNQLIWHWGPPHNNKREKDANIWGTWTLLSIECNTPKYAIYSSQLCMTKVITKNLTKVITKRMKKTLSNTSTRALALAILFIISGIGTALLINPVAATPNASPAAVAPSAAAPAVLTQAEANWELPNGNAQNQNYNPQNQINSSDVNYLGLSWIYPLPDKPLALTSTGAGGEGVGMGVLIVNGTAFATTVFDETIAFNVANGDVLWTFIVPLTVNSTQGLDSGPLALHSHDGNEAFTTARLQQCSLGSDALGTGPGLQDLCHQRSDRQGRDELL